ncbi:hypothetical protein Pyn_02869 [Prunus yedoensis var. nudiflora]|uniref:Uncharacterized protein n=1 Tax=Prunus yedoensis var. nudiflora TaxID=2094558 RepID=A0A314YJ97_PRUYE|nr:hypothetical protein Pyn_02869 [Prunus yedoensis var. nudiflora]
MQGSLNGLVGFTVAFINILFSRSHLGPYNAEDIVEKYPGEARPIPGAVLPNFGQTRVGKIHEFHMRHDCERFLQGGD